jgi:ribosomal protein S18 acetylase RimI-like enzyme
MPRLRVEENYGSARRASFRQLRAHNKQAVGKPDYRRIAITLREGSEIVGALVGVTYWGWLFIEQLWVSEDLRRKGLGKSLLKKAESEARKRGVRNVYLHTYSFQAPGFYRKLGYRQFGRLKDFPVGNDKFWFMKAL